MRSGRALAVIMLGLAVLGAPLQAIGIRRNLAPAPGPPLTVQVELRDQGEMVIDQPLTGLIRRMGQVTVERDRYAIQPGPLGGEDAFGQRTIYRVELGLAANRPEHQGVVLTVRLHRQQSEMIGGYYRPKCSPLPVNNYGETITRQVFVKRGAVQDVPALPGLKLRLTLQ